MKIQCPYCQFSNPKMTDYEPLATNEQLTETQFDSELYATFHCSQCNSDFKKKLLVSVPEDEEGTIISIDGYWKDTKEPFEGYLVSTTEEVLHDESVFFYGLSEQEIKRLIDIGEATEHDFVITSYNLDV